MKTMKFVLLGFAFVLAFGLQAQDAPATKPASKPQREMQKGTRGQAADERHEFRQEMMQKLNLTSEQREALQNINQKHKAEMQALREKSGDQPVDRAAMKALHNNRLEMVKNILTPEQRTIFEAEMAEKKEARRERSGKGGAGKGQAPSGQKAPRG